MVGLLCGSTTDTSSALWSMGLVTSTDGIHWTKGNANPVITAFGPSNFTFQEVGGVFYGWSQITLPNIPGETNQLPSDLMRFVATSPGGPWTALGTATYYRTTSVEGVGNATGQVADPCLISVNGTLYLFYTAVADGSTGSGYVVNMATANSTSLAQLIQTYEGIIDIPIPFSTLQLSALASDNFNRANANPIGGNWTQLSTAAGFQPAQIVSNQVEGTIAGDNSDSWYNAVPWPNDQWAKITVEACTASSYVGVSLRQNEGGTLTAYRYYWNGTAGGTGTFSAQGVVAGRLAVVINVTGAKVNDGDVLLASIIGSQMSLYQNGNLIGTGQRHVESRASGAAGFAIAPITAVTNAALGVWSGGKFCKSPTDSLS